MWLLKKAKQHYVCPNNCSTSAHAICINRQCLRHDSTSSAMMQAVRLPGMKKESQRFFFILEQMWTGELEHRYCLGSIPLKLLTFRHPDKLKGVESEWKKTPKKTNGSRWMDSISTNFETTRMGEICHWWWDQNLSPRIMNTSLTHPQDYPKLYNIYSPWKKNLPKRKTIIFEHHAIFAGAFSAILVSGRV